jgi:hypothetical protein
MGVVDVEVGWVVAVELLVAMVIPNMSMHFFHWFSLFSSCFYALVSFIFGFA